MGTTPTAPVQLLVLVAINGAKAPSWLAFCPLVKTNGKTKKQDGVPVIPLISALSSYRP